MTIRTILREPLLHFLLLGLGLFVVHAAVSPNYGSDRRIVVGERAVAAIVAQYRLQWNRPPTAAELRALVDTQVRDEIVYREGRAMGLDRDDAVIRRRVRQKYELIADEAEAPPAPTDAALDAWRRSHAAAFARPGVVTFDQRAIDGNAQPSLLPAHVADAPLDLVARDFGAGFAAALATAPLGAWVGPVASAYGTHRVRVGARTSSVLPPLADVRNAVTRAWEDDQRRRARSARFAELRAGYDVSVGGLPGVPE